MTIIETGNRLAAMNDNLSKILAAMAYERVRQGIASLRTGNVEDPNADAIEQYLPKGYQRIKH